MNNIEISLGNIINFNHPEVKSLKKVLILGNTKNFFGRAWEDIYKQNENDIANVCFFRDLVERKTRTVIIGEKNDEGTNECEEFEYYRNSIEALEEFGIDTKQIYKFFSFYETKDDNDYIKILEELNRRNMKFDYIIQNPPYAGSLHLDIFDKTLDLLSEKGKMTIIEPATWLINVRRNGKAKLYDAMKEKLKGHIRKVVIENFNKEFQVGLYVPCSITYIDMDNTYNEIEFHCCGETKIVKDIYDCNLVGDYKIIWNILNKINVEKVDKHLYRPGKLEKKEDTWYCKYAEIISANMCGGGNRVFSDEMYRYWTNKEYYLAYTASLFHSDKTSDIQNYPNERRDRTGKIIKGTCADCITGTKEELENWKHFVFNNKLPLFINIVMTIDQHNNSMPYVPWLVDKLYTDDEINKLFGFTDDEIAFMDRTIVKFERYSPWFKRYMCGPTSVSDEEVQKFVDNL